MVNMLSRERKPTTESLQGRPRDGHGPDGHVNSQATQAALQFEGIPRSHDEDALPDPDDAGTVNEPLLPVRPPLSPFRDPLPPEDDLTDTRRRGRSRPRDDTREQDPRSRVSFDRHRHRMEVAVV